MEEVRYGVGGKIMVNQPRKVEPVEKTAKVKKEKNNLFKRSMVILKKMDLMKN